MKNKQKGRLKRLFSGVIAFSMALTMLPSFSVLAEDTVEKYPYTMFAASEEEGAIRINAGNFCVNGNVATNGTIVSSGNMNVNGTKTEKAEKEMIYIQKKLNYSYFTGNNVDVYTDDYIYEELNININNPMDVQGELELTGNINLNTGIKALEDININGEVKNTNNSVIFSETGDIIIDTNNANINGLVYAPYGNVEITAQNLNLNNVIIIADTITLNCPSVNANYSSSMAEMVGTESDIDVELFAFGEYNSEANSIDIEWFTNYTNSSYEVWESYDNVNYSSAAIVSNATTYQYPITEYFETKYFKVSLTTNYGEVVESVPFVVTKTDDGYVIEFLDTDGDGLSDMYEIMFGTDKNKTDTDDDGLTDYQEVCITGTDPAKYDSVKEGISDADADLDGDGLSNAHEIEIGTDTQKSDTDEDGLSDGDEVNVYGTDPLTVDTDGDSLKDSDEPYIGLDPLNPETFGYPDAEYVSLQNISADSEKLSIINTAESPYKLSIDIESTGYVEGNLTAKETNYSKVIENSAMLGIGAELKCDDSTCNIGNVVLKFEIGEEYKDNELNLFPDVPELQGIKRLTIFKYFEDMNMLLPIETLYDEESNTIYTEVDELGTYCVMDFEIWVSNMGILDEENEEPIDPMSFSTLDYNDLIDEDLEFNEEETRISFSEDAITDPNDEDQIAPMMFSDNDLSRGAVTVQTPVDVVFLLQISGELSSTFDEQREMIKSVSEKLFDTYSDVRIYIIGYKENSASMLEAYPGYKYSYLTSYSQVDKVLNEIHYTPTSAYCNRGAAFTLMINKVDFREVGGKFIFQIMNGATTVGTGYFSELDACAKLNINYSEIMPQGYSYIYPSYAQQVENAIAKTNGLNLTFDSTTGDTIYNHIVKYVAPAKVKYSVVVPTGWNNIILDEILSPDNYANSDDDGLTDWEEVDTDCGLISWDVYGNIKLPTFKECLENLSDKEYVENSLVQYQNAVPSYVWYQFMNQEILPIHSNPADEDSDGDGLLDGKAVYVEDEKVAPKDPNPLKVDGPEGMWLAQIEQENNGIISTEYAEGSSGLEVSFNKTLADFLVSTILKMKDTVNSNSKYLRPAVLLLKKSFEGNTEAGAYILNFVYDSDNVAYHSKPDTWQRDFGYNDLYDDVFKIGSYMDNAHVKFNVDKENYALWLWKGDYWNLQSGAEIGLYIYQDDFSGTEHYDVVNFELPMTLSLYNYYSSSNIENLFNWAPKQDQWWATGFNPDFTEPNPEVMISVGTID